MLTQSTVDELTAELKLVQARRAELTEHPDYKSAVELQIEDERAAFHALSAFFESTSGYNIQRIKNEIEQVRQTSA